MVVVKQELRTNFKLEQLPMKKSYRQYRLAQKEI